MLQHDGRAEAEDTIVWRRRCSSACRADRRGVKEGTGLAALLLLLLPTITASMAGVAVADAEADAASSLPLLLAAAALLLALVAAVGLFVTRRRGTTGRRPALLRVASLIAGAPAGDSDTPSPLRVQLLFGTQTGTAERFANQLGGEVRGAYDAGVLDVRVTDLEAYDGARSLATREAGGLPGGHLRRWRAHRQRLRLLRMAGEVAGGPAHTHGCCKNRLECCIAVCDRNHVVRGVRNRLKDTSPLCAPVLGRACVTLWKHQTHLCRKVISIAPHQRVCR